MRPFKSLILLAIASPLMAQRDTAVVPRSLLSAMILHYADRYGDDGEPEVQVGVMPSRLKNRIGIPPGGQILGAVNLREYSVAFGEAPGSAPSLLRWFNDDFRAHGYLPAETSQPSGFVTPSVGLVTEWCDGPRWLSIRTRNNRATLTTASFEISVHDEGYGCGATGPRVQSDNDPEALERRMRPLLVNPSGSQLSSLCNGEPTFDSGNFGSTAETAYRSDLSPAQILAHYARQLDSAGWKADVPAGPAAWGVWTKTDSANVRRSAALLVTPMVSPSGCRHATLQIFKRDK